MKIKKFDRYKIDEMIKTSDVDDVKDYLKSANPHEFTDEFLNKKNLTELLFHAVRFNFLEIETLMNKYDGVYLENKNQGYFKTMFEDTWIFIDRLKDFFYHLKNK